MGQLAVIDAEPTAADVIATLKKALAKAEAGELSSVAIAFVYRDGAAGFQRSDLPSYPAMLGSLARLIHKINTDWDSHT